MNLALVFGSWLAVAALLSWSASSANLGADATSDKRSDPAGK